MNKRNWKIYADPKNGRIWVFTDFSASKKRLLYPGSAPSIPGNFPMYVEMDEIIQAVKNKDLLLPSTDKDKFVYLYYRMSITEFCLQAKLGLLNDKEIILYPNLQKE